MICYAVRSDSPTSAEQPTSAQSTIDVHQGVLEEVSTNDSQPLPLQPFLTPIQD